MQVRAPKGATNAEASPGWEKHGYKAEACLFRFFVEHAKRLQTIAPILCEQFGADPSITGHLLMSKIRPLTIAELDRDVVCVGTT